MQRVLDTLAVTDLVYHHLAFTQPLVDVLVRETSRQNPRRVIAIGPNELLAAVLIDLGFDVDLWLLDGLPLSDDLRSRASRSGQLEEVLARPADILADIVLAPYVVEAWSAEPAATLQLLAASVAPGGKLIVAVRSPDELKRRWRRTRGPTPDDMPPSPVWPRLQNMQRLGAAQLVSAGDRAGLAAIRVLRTTDHRAFLRTEPLSVSRWGSKTVGHVAKRLIPAIRDCTVVTYARSNLSM
ncbi:MAG TPA: hypothetical protein VFB69_04985 [Candidatus Dormibacteraeota bacterium]|nr:hypothetical protein [Candidatus Dormibacteraeota bacterium]